MDETTAQLLTACKLVLALNGLPDSDPCAIRLDPKAAEQIGRAVAQADLLEPSEREKMIQTAKGLALVDLQAFAEGISERERADVANRLEHEALYTIRIASYLEARGALTQGGAKDHAAGVEAQNKRANKVRKALGYIRADDRINF